MNRDQEKALLETATSFRQLSDAIINTEKNLKECIRQQQNVNEMRNRQQKDSIVEEIHSQNKKEKEIFDEIVLLKESLYVTSRENHKTMIVIMGFFC